MTDASRPPLPPPPPSFGSLGNSPAPVPAARTTPPPPAPVAAPTPARVAADPLPQRSPNQPTLAEIVRQAYEHDYSDIHIGVGEVPRFRDRGEIILTKHPVTDMATFHAWLREVLTDAQVQEFEDGLDFDGATQYDFARVRINVFGSLRGPSLVMRLIPLRILSIDQLSLPPVFRDICYYHKGLVLVTGPTGSGKSTTLAAMIDFINQEMAKNIITIEDPIEFVHQSQRSLIKQREVGVHTHRFEAALRASLREDPDIILVGELRDRETINTALKAAQTGHLVMATLHTNSAVKTIERVLNMFEPAEQPPVRVALAESLVAIIAQGLCRTTDGKRAAYHEILINTDAIKDYILRGELDEIEQIIPKCTFDGMCTSNQSLFRLFNEGRITEETALSQSSKPNEMSQLLRGRV